MVAASTRMSQDFLSVIAGLATDHFGDFDADMLLQDWSKSRTEEELLEACFAVLTSSCTPPRMGATLQARRLASATSTGMPPLWSKFFRMVPDLGQAGLDNWMSGFYYQRFYRETFDCFVRLAEMLARPRDRTCIAIVLSTWNGLGGYEAEVLAFIDRLTQGSQDLSPI